MSGGTLASFEKTKLSSDVLGEIWQIADTENRGLLTPSGFGIVLRLIGYAQGGKSVSSELALKRKSPKIEVQKFIRLICFFSSWRSVAQI